MNMKVGDWVRVIPSDFSIRTGYNGALGRIEELEQCLVLLKIPKWYTWEWFAKIEVMKLETLNA